MFILALTSIGIACGGFLSGLIWLFRLKPDTGLVCTCCLVFIWLIWKASLPWFSFQQQQMIRKKRDKKVVCKSLIVFLWRKDFKSLFGVFFFKKKLYNLFCLLKVFFFFWRKRPYNLEFSLKDAPFAYYFFTKFRMGNELMRRKKPFLT